MNNEMELKLDNKAVNQAEKLLQFRRNFIYVALEGVEDIDFLWSLRDVEEFDQLWKRNIKLVEIAETLEKSEMAVMLLALDRMYKGKVDARRGWRIW